MAKLDRPAGEAREAALEVLLHNAHGPFRGLPRTAGWGYPEPYTRDIMISSLGMLTADSERLHGAVRRTLEALAKNQSELGHIPSLAHDPGDRGASDTTPLFLIGLALYRQASGQPDFLEPAARKALRWMEYQAPDDEIMVAQQPTSDWRDEQWVPGYGLYVNALVYGYLRLHGQHERADALRETMNLFDVRGGRRQRHVHEGLVVPHKPYYALWSYKAYNSERFDLLGNSLAVLFGIASPSRSRRLITWVEAECAALRRNGDLGVDLPPNFFPYIRPDDPDWRPRYETYGRPGEYHNGGVWPFICGFYVAAAVAVGHPRIARRNFAALTRLVKPARERDVEYGFNEWVRAQDGRVAGQDWQTWSAAMYLYAAECVETGRTPFFEEVRRAGRSARREAGDRE
ncbi:MAG: glycoside hydrolase 100 family protein [Candidatus Brocadiia bacterium]